MAKTFPRFDPYRLNDTAPNNKTLSIGGRTFGRNPSVRVEGKLFSGVPSSAVMRAARKTQKYALTMVQTLSNVDTGLMRRSWYTQLKPGLDGVELSINNDVFYTKYQEYGTRSIRPRLMATRTVPSAVKYFQTELQRELQTELGGAMESFERGIADVFTSVLSNRGSGR
ncbi:HK97 gp10 family phage protein [Mastigocladus laminosus UU774]|nr:HK97 gp10 family phage protein [Mastigocladus laminosus UU774]